MTNSDKGREKFLREAAKLYDEMISRAGSSDIFDDIEEQAENAGRKIVLKMLRDRLLAETKAQDEKVNCPKCGRPMRRPEKPFERNLDTSSGTVNYERRHAICDSCDESFSPSGREAEDSPPGRLSPPPEKGV